MKVGAWNIGNTAGRKAFKTESIDAILRLDCDLVVITEYCPGDRHQEIVELLGQGGLQHTLAKYQPKANGVLIASWFELRELPLNYPMLDQYSPLGALAVEAKIGARFGPRIIGIRVPYWEGKQIGLCTEYWDWIELTAKQLANEGPALFIGDLNVQLKSESARGGDHFRSLLSSGWTRAKPVGTSLPGYADGLQIDHALFNHGCTIQTAELLQQVGSHVLCGAPAALSDHAALVVTFQYTGEPNDTYLYELVDSVPPPPGAAESVKQSLLELGLTDEQIT
jgi:hypothetical protein